MLAELDLRREKILIYLIICQNDFTTSDFTVAQDKFMRHVIVGQDYWGINEGFDCLITPKPAKLDLQCSLCVIWHLPKLRQNW